MLKFEVRPLPTGSEFGVFAVHPQSGGDAALLAVFELEPAAQALAGYFNRLASFAGG